jgi:type IV conjugative transfer system protein TraL
MEIKKTLDNAPRLVFWRADEALIVLIPFSLGVLFGSILLMIGGFVCALLYRRIRKQNREINVKALLYWYLGAGFRNVPSHIRRIRK